MTSFIPLFQRSRYCSSAVVLTEYTVPSAGRTYSEGGIGGSISRVTPSGSPSQTGAASTGAGATKTAIAIAQRVVWRMRVIMGYSG
ncbi:hypothetical protein [Nannocystis pusilla]|uniref:hypothetical protein n=1 Tax=Nannocystis pusilla TaxID=889268 RepID=UPI003B7C8927